MTAAESLAAAQRTYAEAAERAEECRHARDEAVRVALAEDVPVRDVVAATGLSRERVYQIKSHRR